MAIRTCYLIHDGWTNTWSSGYRNRGNRDSCYSGTAYLEILKDYLEVYSVLWGCLRMEWNFTKMASKLVLGDGGDVLRCHYWTFVSRALLLTVRRLKEQNSTMMFLVNEYCLDYQFSATIQLRFHKNHFKYIFIQLLTITWGWACL